MSKPPSHNIPLLFPGWLIAILSFFFAQSLLGQAITLSLRNGDRITGTIISEDAGKLVLSTPWAKEVTVSAAEVIKREVVNPQAEVAVPGKPVAALPGDATKTVAPPPANASAAAAALLRPIQAKKPKYWAADLQMGVDLAFSEKDQQLYSSRAKITYARNKLHHTFDYLFSYGRANGLVSANRMDGSIKSDVDVGRRFYLYNLAGAGYDQIRLIDLRYEAGPGLGYHLITRSNLVLNVESGANYQAQYLSDNTSTEFFFFRFAENLTWTVSDRFVIDEKFEFFPRVENWAEYRFRFETNLRYWLKSNISLNLTLADQYESNPARNVTQNDVQLRSSIGVKF